MTTKRLLRVFAFLVGATLITAALHWLGNTAAHVSVALSSDGTSFGPAVDAGRDEVGEQRGNGETYGSIVEGERAIAVRVSSDRPIARLSVLDLADGVRTVRHHR